MTPVFTISGVSSDKNVIFANTNLLLSELDPILKVLVTKDILPSFLTTYCIRSFKELCQYLIFPFL